ncbi:MAG TPA: LCP family protein [Acidimicrobiia bacterium]|nr:LCP family protein [Acidimicrobiia bacterium]
MSRRPLLFLVLLALLFVACGGDETTEPATPTAEEPTTTSSTVPPPTTTTTTTPPFNLINAPAELSAAVDSFYQYANGSSSTPPVAPDPVVAALTVGDHATPTTGQATLGTFQGQQLAVVEAEGDTFLVVDDGSGWRIVGGDWPSVGVPAYFGAGPRFVAVVGSDARPGQEIDEKLADSIHFIGLDGAGGGAVVGLPRDSYVPVPGHGKRKATASLALGGPETMMATFTDLTGLPFEGYVMTGFAGFQEMLGTVLGGVEVEVPFAINDRWAKATLEAGKQILDGAQALGFARARKTTGGDLVRSGHQGVILLGAARAVQAMGYSAIPGLMEAAEPHFITDLTPEQLFTFSAMSISADLSAVPNVVAQGRSGSAGGASVVFLNDSVADLWADLADGTLEPQ